MPPLSNRKTRGLIESVSGTRDAIKGIAFVHLLVVGGLAASGLTGCGGVSKSQITDAINEHLKEKICFALEEKNEPTWPMRVRRPVGFMSENALNPIVAAMKAAGYLQVTQERQVQGIFPVTVDVITPTEEAKRWWGVPEGFCVGTKAVAEVQEWTEPGKESGAPIQVQFTWHLVDVPKWASRPEFKDIPGMTTFEKGDAVLQKTNKGWKSVS